MFHLPRGMLLHNPFNIRKTATNWRGEVQSPDKDFEQFQTLEDGIHAGLKIIVNYSKLHGLSTIAQYIQRWAPENENPTSAYTDFVAQRCGVDRNHQYNVLDAGLLCELAFAIIEFEQGSDQFVSREQISAEADKLLGPSINFETSGMTGGTA